MQLDLRNNELIFSGIAYIEEFRSDIGTMKKIKHREHNRQFYFSLEDFNIVRQVLAKKYREQLRFSNSYLKFAGLFITNKSPLHIIWSPALCQVRGAGMPWKEIIPMTSFFEKKALNHPQYGKTWSGIKHLFNATKGEFPSGLLERIEKELQRQQIPYTVERTFEYPEPYIHLHPVFDFTPAQDQYDAVKAMNDANNGIAKLPTGFGKTSFVAAKLIAEKGVKSIFLANQRILIDDAKKDFLSVFRNDDVKIGTIGDGVFDPGDITVASVQGVVAALKAPYPKEKQTAQYELLLAEGRLKDVSPDDKEAYKKAKREVTKYKNRIKNLEKKIERNNQIIPFLKEVDLFVVDEAQVLGTDQWNQFLHACPAPYRYTMSATDTRTDGGRIMIVAATGERRYESSAEEQIKKGRLSEFRANFQKFDHKISVSLLKNIKINHHQAYEIFIVRNRLRNQWLCERAIELAQDYSVLGLVTRKFHGELVQEMLIEMGMSENDMRYIDGDTKKQVRNDTIEAYRAGEFPILIGTSIFDVGFNAKNASKTVNFNAGGSEVRIPQRAGRTVRKRADGSRGESYDIIDINVPFFESQAWKRVKTLREEFGYNRVHINDGVIEGDLDVAGLQEIINALPTETDREKGEMIIESMQMFQDEFNFEPENQIDQIDLREYFEPDLAKRLDQLVYRA